MSATSGGTTWWRCTGCGHMHGIPATPPPAPAARVAPSANPSRYAEMRPGCYDVHERVRDMAAGGQLAGLNFPNWTGFSGQVLNQGPDRDVNLVMIQAYNDWHVDEWCGAYPDRFIPCGILPLWDPETAAKEVHRLAAKGCHAVTFSENPEALNMPSIHSGNWDPLFAACDEAGTVLCCHVGSSSKASSTTSDAPASVPMTLSSTMSIYTLGDLLWADFWWKFPTLRFSLTEGDIGWIPYFLQRAEQRVVFVGEPLALTHCLFGKGQRLGTTYPEFSSRFVAEFGHCIDPFPALGLDGFGLDRIGVGADLLMGDRRPRRLWSEDLGRHLGGADPPAGPRDAKAVKATRVRPARGAPSTRRC